MNIAIVKDDWIFVIISTFLYMLFLLGIWILFKKTISIVLAKIMMKNRLRARKRAMKSEKKLEKHIRKVLSIALKKPIEPKIYINISAAVFVIIVFVGIKNISLVSSLFMAFIIVAMPYLLLRVRIETIRRKSSYEGEKLMAEFVCQYRISDKNIYKTIEQVIIISDGTKITGKLLFKLLLELRSTGNPRTIKEATERFAYGINTNWGRMLANCIRLSAESGTNVTMALEDILIQLREARKMFEERKRLNSEASRMVVFLAPIMYFGTVALSIKYLDMEPVKFIKNQFYTEQGFVMILLIAFLFLLNLALIEIINNQRFDY